jgi:hypothetical protein
MSGETEGEKLRLTQAISGVVNGEVLHGRGRGFAIVRGGELSARFAFDAVPEKFALIILPGGTFTGHQPVARCIDGVINPFNEAQLIRFTRTIQFDMTTALSMRVEYTPSATGVRGKLVFSGTAPQLEEGELVEVEPTVETWIASPQQNAILGRFVMCWRKKDGGRLYGEARSEYEVKPPQDFQPLFRFITIQASARGNQLVQAEEISLFKSLPGHQPTLVRLKR